MSKETAFSKRCVGDLYDSKGDSGSEEMRGTKKLGY